jgi:hypothetical protein
MTFFTITGFSTYWQRITQNRVGNFCVCLVFIVLAFYMVSFLSGLFMPSASPERQQLTAMLGQMPQSPVPANKAVNPMSSPLTSPPASMPPSLSLLQQLQALLGNDATTLSRPNLTTPDAQTAKPTDMWATMDQMMGDMDRAMQAQHDQFQKQLTALKPYTLTSSQDKLVLSIPLTDKREASNYQVDVQPHGVSIHYEKQTKTPYGVSHEQKSFMESSPELLLSNKVLRQVSSHALTLTIPKANTAKVNTTNPADQITANDQSGQVQSRVNRPGHSGRSHGGQAVTLPSEGSPSLSDSGTDLANTI